MRLPFWGLVEGCVVSDEKEVLVWGWGCGSVGVYKGTADVAVRGRDL